MALRRANIKPPLEVVVDNLIYFERRMHVKTYIHINKKNGEILSRNRRGFYCKEKEKLIKEYVDYLNGDEPASTKFWRMEKRIKQDKVSPGVSIELRKKDMVFDLVRLINERVITFDDLEEFSDELREYVEFIQQRLSY